MLEHARSKEAFKEARKYIPGGVNSPVRAFRGVGGDPVFVQFGSGSRVFDVDGNSYVDFVCSWGPLILGHADREVVEAIKVAAEGGTSYGAPTEAETALARLIVESMPSIERVRLVSSGTEAAMSAIRLARAATRRDLVVKFDGCYHGHADGLLVKAGSGALTFGQPDSAGVPAAYAALTVVLPYNDIDAVREFLAARGRETACVIVEPVAANMGVVPPRPGFLEGLRELTEDCGALLIFDEVVTGFRVGPGGAQGLYKVLPDLTVLGKIIGGGMPLGAYGGPARFMDLIAPEGPVYQAGTLSGNPVAVAAGLAVLNRLRRDPHFYRVLDARAARFAAAFTDAAGRAGVPLTLNRVGSMFTGFLCSTPVEDLAGAKRGDSALYGRLFHQLLDERVAMPPSAYEACFVSVSHGEEDLSLVSEATERAFRRVN